MKPCFFNRFIACLSLGLVSSPAFLFADTITASAATRTLSGSGTNDPGTLSLYNDGSNVQRSWLNYDLSAYSGKAMLGDVTMPLMVPEAAGAATGRMERTGHQPVSPKASTAEPPLRAARR